MDADTRGDGQSGATPGHPQGQVMRLNRYLALCGVASRRAAMGIVFEGRVELNGETVTDPGRAVTAGVDRVKLDGALVRPPARWLYYAFHKPRGVLVTASDERGRESIDTYLRRLPAHVFAVGRLDRSSEGLLLLTNHGELAEILLHPRHQIERVYRVKVAPAPRPGQLERMERGLLIAEGEWSAPAQVRLKRGTHRAGLLTITLREGKKREVRRMCRAVGLRVLQLRRIAYAGIRLGELPVGAVRPLTLEELAQLRELTGLPL
jgi:23S rRNA pseudouridine2605 synthase